MKTPKDFDYDLWIAEDGQYMVRVKATHEVCAVNQEVFRKLRSEEMKLRRAMQAQKIQINRNGLITAGAKEVSLDYVSISDSSVSAAWLIDPFDFEQELFLRENIRELRTQLTDRQREVFEKCLIGGMSLRKYAQEKGISHTAVNLTYAAIRKKLEKILGDTFPPAN